MVCNKKNSVDSDISVMGTNIWQPLVCTPDQKLPVQFLPKYSAQAKESFDPKASPRSRKFFERNLPLGVLPTLSQLILCENNRFIKQKISFGSQLWELLLGLWSKVLTVAIVRKSV